MARERRTSGSWRGGSLSERDGSTSRPLLGREQGSPVPVDAVVEGAALRLRTRWPEPLWIAGELVEVRSGRGRRKYAVLRGTRARVQVHLPPQVCRRGAPPAPGALVLVQGTIEIRPGNGEFRIEARTPLIPTGGAGAREEARRLAEDELRREGVFGRAKRPLPEWPRKLAVVSSPHGMAIHDILAVVGRRAPWVAIRLHECAVQGPAAPGSLASAIESANASDADLIIVTRGGGSSDHMDAFDQATVVRSIARSRLPVVVAVGHEPDRTLSDLVADVSAPTPSAGAEQAVPDKRELRRELVGLRERLDAAVGAYLREATSRHTEFHARVSRSVERQVRLSRERLRLRRPETLAIRLSTQIAGERIALDRLREGGNRGVRSLVKSGRQRLDASRPELLLTRLRARVELSRAKLEEGHRAIRALSPHAVLARGYAFALGPDGRVIRTIGMLSPGSRIQIMLPDGAAAVVVERVEMPRPTKESSHDNAR
jgi:exodeoxyribonuclease VII large subunit